jgi:hypothetical protein
MGSQISHTIPLDAFLSPVFLDLLNDWSWDIVASITASLWPGQPGYHIAVPGKMKIILLTKAQRPVLGSHPTSYSMGTGGLFPWG